jgi:hypothetical protein
MRRSTLLGLSLLTTALLGGCGEEGVPSDSASASQGLTNYGRQPNGTGINVASSQPASWFGLSQLSITWFMTGFSQHGDGSYFATGWYGLSIGLVSADAQVVSAKWNGATYNLVGIRTSGSNLSIDIADSQGNPQTLSGSALVGLSLLMQVPDPTFLTRTNYQLRFKSAENIPSQFGDVYGYQMEYAVDGLLGSSFTSYCKGSSGESQRSVFYQGSQWNPMDAQRSDGQNLVTMTCESGSIARCMSWGYRPWGSGQTQSGKAASFADYHQACIHMKRASYCGDSRSNTVDGTPIYINDELSPPINAGSLATLEALWTPTGASCLSNRRHPDMLFLGCSSPLPPCPTDVSGITYLLADGLAQPGALQSLLD